MTRAPSGRPRPKPDSVAADKRYSNGPCPEYLRRRGIRERAINRLKQSRAVATRYDKRGYVFLGTVTTAALLIWLRS
ncbi:hypothetical protein SAMN04490356_0157 [Streptomyces melanosporofaciens]|uniref:Transposase DDE domain-containing protein n=1 Tax=Streptomyces melanosporofaciens TaxID=67327 RepID=A0A1H4I9V0_STRMJ|nr:hypothetical protein SAMN04490356_0157 [Streptomyces melanosporofaciens]